uniref:Coiled-coil domain containing 38 n=1 Tax=Nothoprocta perdicaria TaxID=30464 RepID=A0A8C6Z4K0_NOTPE
MPSGMQKEKYLSEFMLEKRPQKNLRLYEKSTLSSRLKISDFTKQVFPAFERKKHITEEKSVCFPTSSWDIAYAKCKYVFLVFAFVLFIYAVTEKKQTVKHLEELTAQKEKEAKSAEEKLDKELIAFEEFLEQNSMSAMDAFRKLVSVTVTLPFSTEKCSVKEICTLRSEISDAEFLLQESLHYEAFLMELSPKEWQEQQKAKRMGARAEKLKEEEKKKELITCNFNLQEKKDAQNSKPPPCWTKPTAMYVSSSLFRQIHPENPKIYFTDPKQLLQIFSDLEEQNLALIQTIQDLGETVDEIEYTATDKIRILARHKEVLEAACVKEEEKSVQLALKTKMFSVGEFSSEVQDRMLNMLNKKIAEVYKFSVGREETSNLGSIQMLKKIEDRIEELCDLMETIPSEIIEQAEKRKMNERRKRREKELQTERLKSSLQRAIAEPKKKVCSLSILSVFHDGKILTTESTQTHLSLIMNLQPCFKTQSSSVS